MGTILLILLVLLLLGSIPRYSYSRNWGYAPSGVVGLLLIVLLVMVFMNVVPWGWSTGPAVIVR